MNYLELFLKEVEKSTGKKIISDEINLDEELFKQKKLTFGLSKDNTPFIRRDPIHQKSKRLNLSQLNFAAVVNENRGKPISEIRKALKETLTGKTAEETAKEIFNIDFNFPPAKEEIEKKERQELAKELYEKFKDKNVIKFWLKNASLNNP